MTKYGSIPSEKIYSYKPKTLIDLINPKMHYSRQLVESPARFKHQQESLTNSTQPLVNIDPFDTLMPGYKIWLKNNGMNRVEKWIEAKFVRRVSINVFQVAIGNVITNAHRNQLKISKAETPTMNVMVPVTSTKRNRVVTVAEEEASTTSGSFQPEQTNSKPPIDPEAILPALRRSSRTKRRKV